jgi:hypothetical protein
MHAIPRAALVRGLAHLMLHHGGFIAVIPESAADGEPCRRRRWSPLASTLGPRCVPPELVERHVGARRFGARGPPLDGGRRPVEQGEVIGGSAAAAGERGGELARGDPRRELPRGAEHDDPAWCWTMIQVVADAWTSSSGLTETRTPRIFRLSVRSHEISTENGKGPAGCVPRGRPPR